MTFFMNDVKDIMPRRWYIEDDAGQAHPVSVFAGQRLTSCDWPAHVLRDEVVELCQRYNAPIDDTAWIEVDTVRRTIRFCIYLNDQPGHRYAACSCNPEAKATVACRFTKAPGHDIAAACRISEHRIVGVLPRWWQPTTTPR